jgi:hypothetical protein
MVHPVLGETLAERWDRGDDPLAGVGERDLDRSHGAERTW